MRRRFATLGSSVLIAAATIFVVFIVGMRRKSPPVLDAVRRVNRAVFNPRQMASAGTPGAMASVVRHVGRTTDRPYETPVVAFPTDEGFVIVLPYGTRADWVRNVLAAGSATIVHEGETYAVDEPEVVPIATAAAHFGPDEQRTHRLFGVEECLSVRTVG